MADFTKKVKKFAADTLEPGETVLESRVIAPAGDTLRQATRSGIGGLAGVAAGAAMDKRKKNKDAEAGQTPEPSGAAASFPQAKSFFSVTDRRVVVHNFSAMMGRPKELVAAYPLQAIAGLSVDKGKVVHKMTVQFNDGSATTLDLLKGGGDVEGLARALQHAQGQSPQA